MEDSSLSESEVENKGTDGGNEPVGVPTASSAGFSSSSEVHIIPFPGFFCLWSTSLHSYVFLSLLRFGPGTLFKCPPPPTPLSISLIRQTE